MLTLLGMNLWNSVNKIVQMLLAILVNGFSIAFLSLNGPPAPFLSLLPKGASSTDLV